MSTTLIINARIVNEGQVRPGSLYIEDDLIADISDDPSPEMYRRQADRIVDAKNCFLLPGIIDDQVHFREPGLTQKADISTESRAAVAGGITSFMEMPNTNPPCTTLDLLEKKFALAAQKSSANFSFYMGASNDNAEELEKINPEKICGIKVFMGSSTGNMLVDNEQVLERIFATAKTLVATHCEDESTIQANLQKFKQLHGENIQPRHHPMIRSHEACLLSSQKAAELARKHNTRLHILHLSTADEVNLFDNQTPLENKMITGEVCVHHLWFTDKDYLTKGNLIKWNPAVKGLDDRERLWEALLDGTLDVVATDHAPHLLAEKQNPYLSAPSGGPLVQHSLQVMADALTLRNLPIHLLVKWMCHNPALCFNIKKRGFIRKGYYADLVILDPEQKYTVTSENILYKCGWSPFENHTFSTTPTHTFVNGKLVWENGKLDESVKGVALEFNRQA
ncbi:MAG: dihydroorotase [Bacteroidetes bacterium]|nr:MAG: dihydroorotase [Bacteroidota bacterium]